MSSLWLWLSSRSIAYLWNTALARRRRRCRRRTLADDTSVKLQKTAVDKSPATQQQQIARSPKSCWFTAVYVVHSFPIRDECGRIGTSSSCRATSLNTSQRRARALRGRLPFHQCRRDSLPGVGHRRGTKAAYGCLLLGVLSPTVGGSASSRALCAVRLAALWSRLPVGAPALERRVCGVSSGTRGTLLRNAR